MLNDFVISILFHSLADGSVFSVFIAYAFIPLALSVPVIVILFVVDEMLVTFGLSLSIFVTSVVIDLLAFLPSVNLAYIMPFALNVCDVLLSHVFPSLLV